MTAGGGWFTAALRAPRAAVGATRGVPTTDVVAGGPAWTPRTTGAARAALGLRGDHHEKEHPTQEAFEALEWRDSLFQTRDL